MSITTWVPLDIPNWPSDHMTDQSIKDSAAEAVTKFDDIVRTGLWPAKRQALTACVYNRTNTLRALRWIYYHRLYIAREEAKQLDLSGMHLSEHEKDLLFELEVHYNMRHKSRKMLVALLNRINAYLKLQSSRINVQTQNERGRRRLRQQKHIGTTPNTG